MSRKISSAVGNDTAYGPWLAYMMDIKRIDTKKLARRAGMKTESIDALLHGKVAPREARREILKIGEILLTGDPRERMERVIKSLDVRADLRSWSESCDGGCCAWNLVTEISVDPAFVDPALSRSKSSVV